MNLGLKGKTVIVTGGGSNIGRACVHGFAKEGANVVIAELNEKNGPQVAAEVNALGGGGKTLWVKTNVTDIASVEAMAKKAIDEFGQIHVLNNVVGWTFDNLFLEKPMSDFEKEIQLNMWSVINCVRTIAPHMIKNKYGKIVSMGSDAGRMGEAKEAVYGGTKGAVIAMSKAFAREFGRFNINVNVVCPGFTAPPTKELAGEDSMFGPKGFGHSFFDHPEIKDMIAKSYALRRLATAEEVANAVVFLASDAASFITGQTLSVSGGYTMM